MAKKTQESKSEKHELQEAVEEIKQRFGEGAIMKLDEVRKAVDDLKKRSISNGGTRVLLLKKNASIIRDGIGTQLFSLNEAFEKLHKLVQEL